MPGRAKRLTVEEIDALFGIVSAAGNEPLTDSDPVLDDAVETAQTGLDAPGAEVEAGRGLACDPDSMWPSRSMRSTVSRGGNRRGSLPILHNSLTTFSYSLQNMTLHMTHYGYKTCKEVLHDIQTGLTLNSNTSYNIDFLELLSYNIDSVFSHLTITRQKGTGKNR